MRDAIQTKDFDLSLSSNEWMRYACAFWSGRLAELLQSVLSDTDGQTHPSIQFLKSHAHDELGKLSWPSNTNLDLLLNNPPADSALGRIVKTYNWGAIDISLFLIAGLAEIHEGYADVLRMVNPEKLPYAATGLAAQLVCSKDDRHLCEHALLAGPAINSGAMVVSGDGPLFTRQMKVSSNLWSIVNGVDVWPEQLPMKNTQAIPWGLDSWLDKEQCKTATKCLSNDDDIVVRIQSGCAETAINRALSLAQQSGRKAKLFEVNEQTSSTTLKEIYLHCCARNLLPILTIKGQSVEPTKAIMLNEFPSGSILIANQLQESVEIYDKPLLGIHAERLSPESHQKIWSMALPDLAKEAVSLAARFPVEPQIAFDIANDLSHQKKISCADVGTQIRARAGGLSKAGITLVTPTIGWDKLILPDQHLNQLQDSIKRLDNQSVVLNQWGFLKDRRGASGVRLLLAGPPGTGKTLSAEVIAYELGVDLLIVDISRVVSKWIGQTEKNLEQVFTAAEQSKSVLLFDECEALFGKRTEVNDANDRNANLETAYLLTRLEQFEGLVVMSTNMRNNIDPAFLRRLEYIIDFNEPDRKERRAIWECHVPSQAPLQPDVDFSELAAMFPVVGGVIKNAAVTAAFSAAASQRAICKADFVNALRQEYDKQEKAFPAVKPSNQGSSY